MLMLLRTLLLIVKVILEQNVHFNVNATTHSSTKLKSNTNTNIPAITNHHIDIHINYNSLDLC